MDRFTGSQESCCLQTTSTRPLRQQLRLSNVTWSKTQRVPASICCCILEVLTISVTSTMHSGSLSNYADAAPRTLGPRMPAEWEPHDATWLAWPHHRDDWPGKFEPIPWVYAEIIRHLARRERVELIVNDAASEKRARKVLERANAFTDNIRFHRWPTNRIWTRDSGCTFVTGSSFARLDSPFDSAQGRLGRLSPPVSKSEIGIESGRALAPEANLAAVKWRFNAWAKYSNYQHDEQIGSLMAQAADAREFRPVFGKQRVVLEGGSIDVNGQGTLLTTEECLLSKIQQRNPAMKRKDYEKVFADNLGIRKVIWLDSGIAGDDTHGHVDDITRFVAPDTVV